MNIAQHSVVASLRLYKAVFSPLLTSLFGPGAGCRYEPTCSCYSMEAVQRHGALKGLFLTAARLGRCHPWGGCGDDPVTETVRFPFFRRSKESAGQHSFFRRPRVKA